MEFVTQTSLSLIGLALITVSGGMLVLITLVVVRLVPRLVAPLTIIALVGGTFGFVAFCIEHPDPFNIGLGALFVLSAAYHGVRLRRRAQRRTAQAGCDAHAGRAARAGREGRESREARTSDDVDAS